MQLCVAAAGFTPGEADALRRSMAAWRRHGSVDRFQTRIVEGMVERGYARAFAEQVFFQIQGFGEYGFPEAHAASFALLAYCSAWLKRHEPACFLAALINSQPMGFYGPAQLVQDARRHGVDVRPPDVMYSAWDCTLEAAGPAASPAPQPAVRLGLRVVHGLPEVAAQRIVAARAGAPFSSTEDLALRAGLDAGALKALASADALASLSGHRRQQVWDASALRPAPELLRGAPVDEELLELPPAAEGEEVVFDYASTGLTLRTHPVGLLRPQLAGRKLRTSAELRDQPNGRLVRACGLVTVRQQPSTANGTMFVSLEDETGTVNVIVWRRLRERYRVALLQAQLLAVYGTWQRDGDVRHLVAGHLEDLSALLGGLAVASRDFR